MRIITLFSIIVAVFMSASAQLVTYPGAYTSVTKSSFYKVTVTRGEQSEEIVVFQNDCPVDPQGTTSKFLGRTINWANFSFSDSVIVEVQVLNLSKIPLSSVRILPSRYGISAETIGSDKVRFVMKNPGQVSVEIGDNGYKNGLMIFANPLETDVPNPTAAGWKKLSNASAADVANLSAYNALYFEPGVHNIGKFTVPANIKSIYIPGDAWVYGALLLDGGGASNTKIYGRGVLSQAKFALREVHSIETANGANAIKLHGIVVADFKHFALRLVTDNNDVNWVKVIGGWAFNNDGYAGYTGSVIKNSFIWANDDNIKLYRDNLVVENMVCWQLDNGAIFQMGWGSLSARNIRVKNVDVIRAEWTGDRKNNGVISAVMDPGKPVGTQTDWIIENVTVETPVTHIFRISPRSAHNINNMTFRNWDVKMDFGLLKKNYINGYNSTYKISNLQIENLKINGTCITNDNAVSFAKFDTTNVENINFTCDAQTSINQISTKINDLAVSPNPFSNELSIVTNAQNIKLYDATGRAIHLAHDKTENGFKVSTNTLLRGMYFLKAGASVQKIIKK